MIPQREVGLVLLTLQISHVFEFVNICYLYNIFFNTAVWLCLLFLFNESVWHQDWQCFHVCRLKRGVFSSSCTPEDSPNCSVERGDICTSRCSQIISVDVEGMTISHGCGSTCTGTFYGTNVQIWGEEVEILLVPCLKWDDLQAAAIGFKLSSTTIGF